MAQPEEETPEKPKGSSVTKILLLVLIPLIVAGATVGGLYFAGVFGGDKAHEDAADPEADSAKEEPAGPAKYIPMEPAFVVNFPEGSKARFLQITMELMTRKPEVDKLVELHMPAIRNNLVLLFSSQTYERISTLEGKEALREEALGVVQEVLEQETGDPGVEAVYFTSLVMQ